jgi:hypothetical protein
MDRKGLKMEMTPTSAMTRLTGAAVVATAVGIWLGTATPFAKAWELEIPYYCPGVEDPFTCATGVEGTMSIDGAHAGCVGEINSNGIQAYYNCWDAYIQSRRTYFLNLASYAYGWMAQNNCGDAHSTPYYEQPNSQCGMAGFDFAAGETLYNGLAFYTTGYGYYYLYGSS